MCKIHNSVGCLTTIKRHLERNSINDFKSINELLNFQKNFAALKLQIVSDHEILIEEEKIKLKAEITELENNIKTDKAYFEKMFYSEIEDVKEKLMSVSNTSGLNFIKRIINYIKRRTYISKLEDLESCFDYNVEYAISKLVNSYNEKTNRYNYISLNLEKAIEESALKMIKELENKLRVIDEINNSIYGAIGEHKVVKELENLSDENILINDFTINFHPAIYFRQEDDYIKSIQIDHLLVTPAGLFLIETKNWSVKSLANLDLRSPVQQVRRSNFALFKTLTDSITKGRLSLKLHHWGNKRIPIRNVIALTNSKINDEFQYVKIVTLDEICNYIKFFKPIFTNAETELIADYLLNCKD